MARRRNGDAARTVSNVGGADGALDRVFRHGQKKKSVPAIFVHAGAGFHSHQNEQVHLNACVAAAQMGMRFLKAGSSATEAVEATLRVLEDKEITNAGYGSNLAIDGTVECDATIVDHLGRSGACGAVPNIRNPISLAKLILDASKQPLSLRRVPPNALVGEGAKLFAEEYGMETFANEYLVSKSSRDRFLRWQDDLKKAEARNKDTPRGQKMPNSTMQCAPYQFDTSPGKPYGTFPRDHAAAIMSGTWNEGQPNSPYSGTPVRDVTSLNELISHPGTSGLSGHGSPATNISPAITSRTKRLLAPSRGDTQTATDAMTARGTHADAQEDVCSLETPQSYSSVLANTIASNAAEKILDKKRPGRRKRRLDGAADGVGLAQKRHHQLKDDREDMITDTIGAIAIDEKGLIAAGSSSGGIGMKHRGRLGPAALVGIGTAVIPCQEDDEDNVTVAAVTSGTGEHMATTMASQRCAERLYQGNRRGQGGKDVQEDDESIIMDSFIMNDFMGHQGVKNCSSVGAIGVMAVKKCRTGYYLYFAHNTDSFALASMGGSDKEPVCVMSRLMDGGKINQGARKVSAD